MSVIVMVRHGENDWAKENRLAGWRQDVHLNKNGRRQARQAASRLASLPVTAVYSSPIARCLETAATIAASFQLKSIPLAAVGEVRYGQWEGKKVKKLAREPLWQTVQYAASRARFPGGEAIREVQARAVAAVEALAAGHAEEVVVLVSHADVIKLILANYLGMHIDQYQRLVIGPGSISILALAAVGAAHVLRFNDDGPLTLPVRLDEKRKRKKGKSNKKS